MTPQNAQDISGGNSHDEIRMIVDRLLFLLHDGLSPYVELQMQAKYKMGWIARANRHLAHPVDPAFLHFDVHALLIIIMREWEPIFRDKLAPVQRRHVRGLIVLRNRWAHQRPVAPALLQAGLANTHRILEAVGAVEQAGQVANLQERFARILQGESEPEPEAAEGPSPQWGRIGLTVLLLVLLIGLQFRSPSLGTLPATPSPTLLPSPSEPAALATVMATVMVTATAMPTSVPPTRHRMQPPFLATPTPVVYNALSVAPSNLRAGPGTSYAIVGTVLTNVPLRIVGRDRTAEWYKLESGAWIAAFLADIDPALPVVDPDPTATPSPTPCRSCPPPPVEPF